MRAKVRTQIKKRDGYRCRYCGVSADVGAQLTVDHIIPLSRGGHPEKKANLATCCFPCNQKKANKTPDEAGMVLLQEGFEYLPPGRMADGVTEMKGAVIVNHGRKQKRKSRRKARKQLVKAIMRDGLDQYLCKCGRGGKHTPDYHERNMT